MDKSGELREISAKEGDMTKCIRVEKIENGFLVCESNYGYKDAKKEKYISEEKKYFSATNPLMDDEDESKEKTEEKESPVISSLKNFMNSSVGELINTK